MNDPIVEEVRKARDEYAARFNYDLEAMVRDLREQERLRKCTSGIGTKPLSHPAAAPRGLVSADADKAQS